MSRHLPCPSTFIAVLAAALIAAPLAHGLQLPPGSLLDSQAIDDVEGALHPPAIPVVAFGTDAAHVGDLNGDGRSEVAVASWGDVDGFSVFRGQVWILFLATDGTVQRRTLITPGQAGLDLRPEEALHFGGAVTGLGDLNGDGVPDIAVGSQTDTDAVQSGGAGGAVWILFLRRDGTVKSRHKISASTTPFLAQAKRITRIGHAVGGLGDVNGDGHGDLVVSASRLDGTPGGGFGVPTDAMILFLRPDGSVLRRRILPGSIFGVAAVDSPFGTGGLSPTRFADALEGLGDLDGDGTPDLAIGVPVDPNLGGASLAYGAVYIARLRPNGSVKAINKISTGVGGFLDPASSIGAAPPVFRFFGDGLGALGDIDGDGTADLAVGSTGLGGFGRVWVLRLSPQGAVIGQVEIDQFITAPTVGGTRFGSSLASPGDLDGDGGIDLLVGAPSDAPGTQEGDAFLGAAHVLFLSGSP